MQKPLNTIKVLFLGLLLALGISYVQAAWVGPTATPPGNNTTAPVNIGSLFQQKSGDLWARSMGTDNGFCIGKSCVTGWPQSCPSGQAINEISTNGAVTCVAASGGTGGSLAGKSCPSGQYVSGVDAVGNLICGTPLGGGSTNVTLVNGAHTGVDCVAIGGSVSTIGTNTSVCRASGALCPSGWTKYQNWSTGSSNTCNGNICTTSPGPQGTSCTVSGWAWANQTPLSCTYHRYADSGLGGCVILSQNQTCVGPTIEVGCY
jgi:hypothetical protein